MDVMSVLNVINQGGPTAVCVVAILVIAGFLRIQHGLIKDLRHDLNMVIDEFKDFQIANAKEIVRKDDVDEIKDMIRKSNDETRSLINRILERFDDHVTRCGTNCLASIQARVDFQNSHSV